MSILFFDIETYVDKNNQNSGLNPLEKESKVYLISYSYHSDERDINEVKVEPILLKEWEYGDGGEKEILSKFYDFLKEKVETDTYTDKNGVKRCALNLSGFNVLGFDLPFLFNRMVLHGIDSKQSIYENLFTKPWIVDLMQISVFLSDKIGKYNKLAPSNQKMINSKLNISVKEEDGKKMSLYYVNKEYNKILKYVDEEFTFNILYCKLKEKIKNLKL